MHHLDKKIKKEFKTDIDDVLKFKSSKQFYSKYAILT